MQKYQVDLKTILQKKAFSSYDPWELLLSDIAEQINAKSFFVLVA